MRKLLLPIALLGFFLEGCYYAKKPELLPPPVAAVISYDKDIKPIFQAEGCESCHTGAFAQGGYEISDYNGAKNPAFTTPSDESARLYMAVAHTNPNSAKWMPQGGNKIPEARIQTILQWIKQGTPQ